jgi:hypothetical protein
LFNVSNNVSEERNIWVKEYHERIMICIAVVEATFIYRDNKSVLAIIPIPESKLKKKSNEKL